MASSPKKISFGFSKTIKDTIKAKPIENEKKEVQYVDSFDGDKGKFSFKGSRVDKEKKELVIPLIGTRTAYEVIQEKLAEKDIKPTLEELAAREILNDLKTETVAQTDHGLVIKKEQIPPNLEGKEVSTLEDYENVPIGEFGLAMLRGMGWTPKTGIGKEQRVVAPIIPKIRPKRLGLGAEPIKTHNLEEQLPLKRGCFIKVVSGHYRGQYGVVQSLDGDCAQAFVKFDSGNASISEHILEVVSQHEYLRNVRGVEPVRIKEEGRKKKKKRSKSPEENRIKRKKHKKKKYASSSDSDDNNFRRKGK